MLQVTLLTGLAALSLGAAAHDAPTEGPVATPATAPAAGPVVALKATRVHLGDGTVLDEGIVTVQDGKILAAGANAALPEGAVLVELQGELSPGLVALRDFSTARGENVDSTRNVLPDADLAHAFDAGHRDAAALVAQGITTALLAAPGSQLVGGLAAAVDPGSGQIVERGAMLCVGAGTRALSFNRYPTSTAAQYAELDARFSAGDGVYARARAGELPLLMDVTDRADVLRAAAFAKRHGLQGALVGAVRWAAVADAVKDAGLSAVIGPITVGGWGEAPREAAALAAAGVRVGFGCDAPDNHPSALRATAAMCILAGMPAGAALKALTGDAAAIAGVADKTGRIAAGLEADLVLWSGAPTDLTSRPLKVWSDGELVHEAAAEGAQR